METCGKSNLSIYEEIRGISFVAEDFFRKFFDFNLPYSPFEIKVLFQLGKSGHLSATYFSKMFHIDLGYINRTLKHFLNDDIVERRVSGTDKRAYDICLTEKGEKVNEMVQKRYQERVDDFLKKMSQEELDSFKNALKILKCCIIKTSLPVQIFDGGEKELLFASDRFISYFGDKGIENEKFYQYIKGRVKNTIDDFPKGKSVFLMAEMSNELIGGCLLKIISEQKCEIRYLYVEPSMREAGIGSLLFREILSRARGMNLKHVSVRCYSFQNELPKFVQEFSFQKEGEGKLELSEEEFAWTIYGKNL